MISPLSKIPMNSWLKVLVGTVGAGLIGAGIAWGTLTMAFQTHKESSGHPTMVERVNKLAVTTAVNETRLTTVIRNQEEIRRDLKEIKRLLGKRGN